MKKNHKRSLIISTLIILFTVVLSYHSIAQDISKNPKAKLIKLDPTSTDRVKILDGPPETVSMRSGFMVLPPSKSVGKHSTKKNEEAIVVLAGEGEFRIIGGKTFQMHPYSVIYCPPNTEHDVMNTGYDTLRYVYIVAKAKNEDE